MSTLSESDLEAVIRSRHGTEHYLTHVAEETDQLGRSFPPGTRMFVVEYESRTCTHTPCCHWFGFVYWYEGRFTLIKQNEIPFLKLGELVDRITRAVEN